MSGHGEAEPSRVLLDACTLVPIRLATTVLWLAEDGLIEPLWSEEILDEVERTLPKTGISVAKASRRVEAMRQAFGAVACVDDFDHLIPRMTCDRRDRHVPAAAVRGDAETLVTFNLRDFPKESTACHGVKADHPDRFLATLLSQSPVDVVKSLARGTLTLRNPPRSLGQFLASSGAVPGISDEHGAAVRQSRRGGRKPVGRILLAGSRHDQGRRGTCRRGLWRTRRPHEPRTGRTALGAGARSRPGCCAGTERNSPRHGATTRRSARRWLSSRSPHA